MKMIIELTHRLQLQNIEDDDEVVGITIGICDDGGALYERVKIDDLKLALRKLAAK